MARVGKFDKKPAIRPVERWTWELTEDLTFNDPLKGELTVPAGFVSDLASIRVLREICRWSAIFGVIFAGALSQALLSVSVISLAIYALLAGYAPRTAILHDWLYTQGELSRKECDAILYRAGRTGEGMAAWRCALFWVGVRLGGFGAYSPNRV